MEKAAVDTPEKISTHMNSASFPSSETASNSLSSSSNATTASTTSTSSNTSTISLPSSNSTSNISTTFNLSGTNGRIQPAIPNSTNSSMSTTQGSKMLTGPPAKQYILKKLSSSLLTTYNNINQVGIA